MKAEPLAELAQVAQQATRKRENIDSLVTKDTNCRKTKTGADSSKN